MGIKSSLTAVCALAAALGVATALSTPAEAQYDPSKKVLRAPVSPSPQYKPAPQYKPPIVVHPHGRPSHGGHYGHKHRSNDGRNIAAGVAAGVIGAIILNEAAKASSGDSNGLSCEQLERRCDDGKDWACRKLERSPVC